MIGLQDFLETARQGQGNVIFLDGSNEGLEKSLRNMTALQHIDRPAAGR